MSKPNVDNGETQNPVESDIGIVNQSSLAESLKGILFTDEQDVSESELAQQSDEVQTEDKEFQAEVEDDGLQEDAEEVPEAEDGTEVLSQEEDEEESTPEPVGVQKRIDKLTALRKQAEEKVEALAAEVEEYRSKLEASEQASQKSLRTEENPFGDLDSVEKIKTEYEQARQLRWQCEQNPEGFQVGDTYFSSEQVRAMKVNAMKAMEIQLPKQLEFVKAKAEWQPKAYEAHPWLKNKETAEYKLAQQVLKTFPEFKKFPDYEMFVGDYVRGYLSRNNTKKQLTKSVPQLAIRPTSTPSQSSRNDTSARNLEARYLKTGRREDLKAVVSKFL